MTSCENALWCICISYYSLLVPVCLLVIFHTKLNVIITITKGCFRSCQRFWKFWLEVKWKGLFRFPSDWNVWDHLWRWSTLTAWIDLTESSYSILMSWFTALLRKRNSHWPLTSQSGIMESTL